MQREPPRADTPAVQQQDREQQHPPRPRVGRQQQHGWASQLCIARPQLFLTGVISAARMGGLLITTTWPHPLYAHNKDFGWRSYSRSFPPPPGVLLLQGV